MTQVKNLLFQPLTFHLRGGKEGLHLGPRQRRTIATDQISPELERAARRGFVAITELAEAAATAPQTAADTHENETGAAKRSRKRRA